ncbi:MAG: hypothetical protein QGG64_17150 [Candidatus Latescibacteria bacterium]|nr:hypothetical protein [Candidatus Latescibacterota bacterium]
MQNKPSRSIQIRYTPEFKRNLRMLAKKYRRIRSDVQPIITSLREGDTPGDQITGTNYVVFKVRVSSPLVQHFPKKTDLNPAPCDLR